MIWVILVVVIVIIAFKLGNKTGEMVSSANSAVGCEPSMQSCWNLF